MNSDIVTDVVIITALSKERDAVLRHLDSFQVVETKGRIFYKATVRTRNSNNSYQIVLLSLLTMGNLEAALATQQAISVWNPSYIILTGIAGGVQKGTSRYLGDLLVGEQIVSYESGKQTESGIQRRYDVYRPAKILLDAAKNLPIQNWALSTIVPRPDGTTGRVIPHVHFGVVASGEKVVTDSTLISELQSDWSQLVGIEMEGVGIALAAYNADDWPGILLVKGMCDWADSSKNDDWQEYAADAAASFVIGLLKSEPFKSRVKSQPIRKDGKPLSFSGQAKISICRKLVKDWEDLADYFDIPDYHRARFVAGREPQAVWEWLSQRDKLSELESGLEFIGRDDLVKMLKREREDTHKTIKSSTTNSLSNQPPTSVQVPRPEPAKSNLITPVIQQVGKAPLFKAPLDIEKLILFRAFSKTDEVLGIGISADGQTLFSWGGNTISIWNPLIGEFVRTITSPTNVDMDDMAISADGQTLVSVGSMSKGIRIWNLPTGELVRIITENDALFNHHLTISADGQMLVSMNWDTINVWNLLTGELVRTITTPDRIIGSLAMSADGQTLVSGGGDTFRIWNPFTGELVRTITIPKGIFRCAAISADGQTLVRGSRDKAINVWNPLTGEYLQTIRFISYPFNLAISADGQTLVSGHNNGTLNVWNPLTGEHLRTIKSHTDTVWYVAISADGQILVSAGVRDTTIKVWRKE